MKKKSIKLAIFHDIGTHDRTVIIWRDNGRVMIEAGCFYGTWRVLKKRSREKYNPFSPTWPQHKEDHVRANLQFGRVVAMRKQYEIIADVAKMFEKRKLK